MKLMLCVLAIGLCALAAPAHAQNSVDGKWAGEVQGGRGGEVAIKEGTISGSTIKFKTTQMGRGGNEVNISWSGTLKGDEIAMTRTIEGGQGQPQEFTLKRQK